MLFFRSEEKLNQWLEAQNTPRGAMLSIDQLWELSQRWYHNRLSLEYHGRTMEEGQEILKGLGLTSAFWRID